MARPYDYYETYNKQRKILNISYIIDLEKRHNRLSCEVRETDHS